MKHVATLVVGAAFALLATSASAAAEPGFDSDLDAIQQAWAVANYETTGDARTRALASLETTATEFAARHPDRAEPLIWKGIVESTYAGAKGGLGALREAKKARTSLEAALALNPAALDGSAYTSLGALYYKVPGFPLGFGDRDKAGELLQHALALNPNGIDPNFFNGELQYEQGRYEEALRSLEKASQAPPRPGRDLADRGRRAEIAALAAKVREKAR